MLKQLASPLAKAPLPSLQPPRGQGSFSLHQVLPVLLLVRPGSLLGGAAFRSKQEKKSCEVEKNCSESRAAGLSHLAGLGWCWEKGVGREEALPGRATPTAPGLAVGSAGSCLQPSLCQEGGLHGFLALSPSSGILNLLRSFRLVQWIKFS